MSKLYYTLIERDSLTEPWTPQFGDYDRSVVKMERRDRHESYPFPKLTNMMVICTYDNQGAIDAHIAMLNSNHVNTH